jgi:ATP-dependent Clp protease adaptor protein ClpS|tara:strand:- start:557 stop:826 length:270 start_codon:yes stop_codon:yes gene_type:complete
MATKKKPRQRRKRLHLYLLNDDTNSVEYVVNILMYLCNHNTFQAEQCALITHTVGKCHIYSSLNGAEILVIYETLLKSGLNVELKDKIA